MAITNRERVGKAMDLLRDGLAPFVERERLNARGKHGIERCWKRSAPPVARRPPVIALAPKDTRLDEVTDRFFEEERVALSPGDDRRARAHAVANAQLVRRVQIRRGEIRNDEIRAEELVVHRCVDGARMRDLIRPDAPEPGCLDRLLDHFI